MKICPNEHTLNNGDFFPDDFFSCPICGSILQPKMQNIVLKCNNCNFDLESGWIICPACQNPVSNAYDDLLLKRSRPELYDLIKEWEELEPQVNCYHKNISKKLQKIIQKFNEIENRILKAYNITDLMGIDSVTPSIPLEVFLINHIDDINRKIELKEKVSENGDRRYDSELFEYFAEKQTYAPEKAFSYAKKDSSVDNLNKSLALCYALGIGVNKDIEHGLELFFSRESSLESAPKDLFFEIVGDFAKKTIFSEEAAYFLQEAEKYKN